MHNSSVSIIIPTLNSAKTLNGCLESIFAQNYSREKLEIIIVDAGSCDDTVKIVDNFKKLGNIRIDTYSNPLLTGEAGKAVGFKNSRNEFVVFLDSDNLLPDSGWLKRMIQPFDDPDIIASEPLEYTYRKEDSFVTRYCALIGMNDPLCLFLGNYDRYSILTNRWTRMPHKAEDVNGYLKVSLDKKHLPTIGANGFFIRRSSLEKCNIDQYLFDIDIVCKLFKSIDNVEIAKVKTSIIHIFSSDIKNFARKQRRRVRDYLYYSRLGIRKYPWKNVNKSGLAFFLISCLTLLPLFAQSIRGFLRKQDWAWFFHPLACWITLIEYGSERILGIFIINKQDRSKWKQ